MQNVEYNPGFDPNAPPPYSTYFTTPPYSERKEHPPAYSNYGYNTSDSVATPTATESANDIVSTNATSVLNAAETETPSCKFRLN